MLQLLGSSLVSAIAAEELTAVGNNIMMQTFRNFEVFGGRHRDLLRAVGVVPHRARRRCTAGHSAGPGGPSLRDFGLERILVLLPRALDVLLSLMAFAGGGAVRLVIAPAASARGVLRTLMVGYIQLMQGTPALMQLFIVYYGIGLFGMRPDPWTSAANAFSVSVIGVFRGDLARLHRGDSARRRGGGASLGLRFPRICGWSVLPQALRIMIPPTIGYMVQIIKGTSLASLVGFTELARAGQVINTDDVRAGARVRLGGTDLFRAVLAALVVGAAAGAPAGNRFSANGDLTFNPPGGTRRVVS